MAAKYLTVSSSAVLGVLLLILPAPAMPQNSPPSGASEPEIEIVGSRRGSEGYERQFALLVREQPVHDSDEAAYSPLVTGVNGDPLYAARQSPLELYWDFGDGLPAVLTKHHVSVSHVFEDEGNFTVTVSVRDHEGEFATASREIEILNRDPRITMAATVVDPARHIVELTAFANDSPGDDDLIYQWDFGDGDTASGSDLWWSRHQYAVPGEYEVTLTVTDDDYPSSFGNAERNDGLREKSLKVLVSGETAAGYNYSEEEVTPLAVLTNRLTGTTSGAIDTELEAGIRHFRGLYLQPVSSGTCRFVFTAWDDSLLTYAMGIVDLRGLPEEGARYRVSTPRLSLHFVDEASRYAATRRSWMGPAGPAGLGAYAQGVLNATLAGRELTEEQKRQVDAALAEAGVEAGEGAAPADSPMPSLSPFGIDGEVSFSTEGGYLELDFLPGDRAVGEYDVMLRAGFGPMEDEIIPCQGSFDLDLVAARQDGLINYRGCEPAPFEVKSTFPKTGTQHFTVARLPIRVSFTQDLDPDSIKDDSFQLTYVGTSDEPVPLAARLLPDRRKVYLVPDEPLLPGVYYTVRVKTGDDGVRSLAGMPLETTGQDEWYSWKFTTQVDVVPEPSETLAGSKRRMACDVYQAARNAPLIPEKPAVARIFASWQKQASVHPDHQVKQFQGRVVLRGAGDTELASQNHTFVRPDLWEEWGIDQREMEHSAQLTGFIPTKDMGKALLAGIEVPVWPGEEDQWRYSVLCPLQIWDLEPELSIDFVALPIDEWGNDPGALEGMMPVLQSIADDSVEYAMQVFPFADIRAGPVRSLAPPMNLPPVHPSDTTENFRCRSGCLMAGYGNFEGIADWLSSQSTADVVIAFGPHLRLVGGYTDRGLSSGRGLVLSLASNDAGYHSRYVFAAVHELGHVLGLDHLPYMAGDNAEATENRIRLDILRQPGTAFEYHGIEGLRLSRDGSKVWNKSAREGNGEDFDGDQRLFPLMFPATVPTANGFISDHNYRAVQKLLEEIN